MGAAMPCTNPRFDIMKSFPVYNLRIMRRHRSGTGIGSGHNSARHRESCGSKQEKMTRRDNASRAPTVRIDSKEAGAPTKCGRRRRLVVLAIIIAVVVPAAARGRSCRGCRLCRCSGRLGSSRGGASRHRPLGGPACTHQLHCLPCRPQTDPDSWEGFCISVESG